MNISIYNEYDPLKTVIIGDASQLYFPDAHAIENELGKPWWEKLRNNTIFPLLRGRKVPQFITKQFQKELEEFEKLLTENQIKVLKVEPFEPPVTDKPEELGMGQMYARDSTLCVGDLLVEGNLQIDMRKKERLGFQKIVEEIKKDNKVATMPQSEKAYLEGSDVLVDYPNVFVGIGKYASNWSGINWLRKRLCKSWKIVPVYLKNKGILHLDCCMTIIGPKTAIICHEVLGDLPEELKDYTFIEIDKKVRQEMGGNVLVLGNNKVIVQQRHQKLQEDLKKHGFSPLPMSFTWHALMEGAFRCASCPLERKSASLDVSSHIS